MVVGFPPGSSSDTVARLLGQKFAEAWGKPVLIDNAAGAAGNIAADRVAKAEPDGYTLGLLASPPLVVNPSLRSEEHTSELQSLTNLVCRLLLEKKKNYQS